MRRIHLFEFEDLEWFPKIIRDGGTDFLGFMLSKTRFYEPAIDILEELIIQTNHNSILDLCSGNGGPVEYISARIDPKLNVRFVLSDKYPNLPAYRVLKEQSNGKIDYQIDPLDVMDMNSDKDGIRTMFSAIHHFEPKAVEALFKNMVKDKMPICILDGGDKKLSIIISMLIFHPILFFVLTPFFRPYRLTRIVFTYLIPIIPIYTIWDGIVSILRLYGESELLELAKSADENNSYTWQSGKVKNSIGLSIIYLTGIPDS